VLVSSLMVAFLFSPFPPGYRFQWASVWNQSRHHEAIARVLAQVSEDGSLSAQSDLLPHVANRRHLFLFPHGMTTADEILLDLDNAAERAPLDYFTYLERVQQVLNNPTYGPVAWDDGVLLLRRGLPYDSDLPAVYQAYTDDFYDVTWLDHTVPAQMAPRQLYPVQVCFENSSSQGWPSENWFPVFLAYHWFTDTGEVVVWDGERTRLAHILYPEQQLCQTLPVISPDATGFYTLQIDLVRETVAWFGNPNSPPLSVTVFVAPSP
jgi:hypothetical protein